MVFLGNDAYPVHYTLHLFLLKHNENQTKKLYYNADFSTNFYCGLNTMKLLPHPYHELKIGRFTVVGKVHHMISESFL